ncbi:MAG: hypothetical protein QY318_01780 [Candidatus Dojkabacteria bacterium]|nr:MAG: hypothetical protein QY318_01780 [Candidatus Dojkabacteria bacterium]
MKSRELKRLQLKYGSLLDPFAIVLLIILYSIPILAVINLTPRIRQSLTEGKSVLGSQDNTAVAVTNITGVHTVITNEEFDQILANRYEYSARLAVRDEGSYSKPFLKVSNPTLVEQTVEFLPMKESSSSTELAVIFDDVSYVVAEADGETFSRQFTLKPGEEKVAYLRVRNESRANFSERVKLEVNVSQNFASDSSEE